MRLCFGVMPRQSRRRLLKAKTPDDTLSPKRHQQTHAISQYLARHRLVWSDVKGTSHANCPLCHSSVFGDHTLRFQTGCIHRYHKLCLVEHISSLKRRTFSCPECAKNVAH